MKTLLHFAAKTALALMMGTPCFGQHYTRINLVSNTAGAARVTDPQLINPWGMSRSPSSAWWVSDQRTGFTTVYNGAGTTGKFNGLLQDAGGKPLAIKGILALNSGNAMPNNSDSSAASASQVYFTAGPNHGSAGLFGYVAAVSTEDHVEEASLWSPRSPTDIHAHINSTPTGADIQVDGVFVGATPSDIDLTCCWHDVTIIKPGRKPWTTRVRNTGRQVTINAQLRK